MASVEKLIEEMRLGLQADGADVELIEKNDDGSLKLRVSGKSKGCQTIGIDLQTAVIQYLRRGNSQIKDIVFE